MDPTPAKTSFHRRVAVDTPEHVRLDYVLADVGSRAAALAIDLAVLMVGLLLLGLAFFYIGRLGSFFGSVSGTLLFFATFFVQWGYFLLFEALGGGRTPGKRAIGLRVVHVGGEPLSFQGSVLRNLIRIVDLQPGITGVAGAVCILANKRAQRLGDMVAGTMVVRDAGGGELLATDALPSGRVGRPLLSVEQFELLAGYMARREALDPLVRRRVADSVLTALGSAVDLSPVDTRTASERVLSRLHEEEAPRHAARRGGASLQAATMAREQREEWAAYSELVEKGRKRGLKSFTEGETRRFGQLYRGMAADLERARTYGASPGLLGTVQRWAGAGHNLLYRARGRATVSLGQWMWAGFPRSVRRFHRPILLAALLFFGPMVATYAAVGGEPQLGRSLMGPGMLTRAENTVKDDIDAPYIGEIGAAAMPLLSSNVITNNIGVTFLTFAGGFLAGAGTLFILVLNGIVIGAALGAYANEEVLGVILAFVFSHGFIELGAICIAGGAGFGLGSALLMPGRRTRAEALRERGRTFVSLLAGTSLMLVIAGLIEGFYSPSTLPAVAKFTFGSATALLMLLYFGFAGRKTRTPASATAAPAP
ncbi:MAG: stage II sporulation protein M [Gemmatimonadota bacterium]|nr:stage II sporulation protein M [Acidobacteriota bacterium]MDE2985712.1 stage II sporulation protein M [Gemmatimonadota bacterium]